MFAWPRIFPAMCLAGAVLVLSACSAPAPSTVKPGNNGGVGTTAESGADADADSSVTGPQAAECPQGLRDLAAKLPEETFTGDEISVGQFLSSIDSKYVAVGLAPSCVFESTQNNTKHSVFYVGEGKDFLASLADKLTAEGLVSASYNNDHSQNWSNEYRSVVVSIEYYSVGDDNPWPGVDFGDELVWAWIAFVPE